MLYGKKLITILLISLTLFPFFSQPKGVNLCDSVFDSLKKQKTHPQIQTLVSSSDNFFPYNIYMDFNSKVETDQTLLFIFNQEDYLQNDHLFSEFLQYLKNSDFDFNIQILFSYGEKQKNLKDNIIYGQDIFLDTIDYKDNYTVIIFNLSADYNKIISSSNGKTAPAWLVKNLFEIIPYSNIDFSLPFYYVSQQFRYNFYNDRQLDTFLSQKIPSVKFNLKDNVLHEDIYKFLQSIINSYSFTTNKDFDQNFLVINLFGKSFCYSETLIVRTIILIILSFVFFLVIFFDVNAKLQKKAWKELKSIWYAIPSTFICIIFGCILGQVVYLPAENYLNSSFSIYFLYSFYLLFSFILCTIYYIFEETTNNFFSERAIDYLIVITTFVNQFIFLFVDVSLFPVFMLTCFFAILSILFKRNSIHIFLFVLMIFPYVIYAHLLMDSAPLEEVKFFLTKNIKIIPTLSFAFCPIFLMFFRILTGNRRKFSSHKALYIESVIIFSILLISCILLSSIRSNMIYKKNQTEKISVLKADSSQSISIKITDNTIMNETIRTLYVDFDKEPEQASIKIIGMNTLPVLYSDNSYVPISTTSIEFLLPENSSKNLIFNYGTNKKACTILVTALYSTGIKNEFIKEYKTLQLEE